MGQLLQSADSMKTGVGRVAEHLPDLPVDAVVLLRLVHIAGNGLDDLEETWLKPHRLKNSEFRTLMMLFSSPDHATHPSELCRWATQKPTNMTRIIDGLLQRGLVTRKPDKEDRRRVILKLTAPGEHLVRTLLPQLHPRVSAMFTNFSTTESRQFRRLLEKLLRNLDPMTPGQE